MTDPVETLAEALIAVRRDPSINVHDLARALIAQITPALVAEAVKAEKEACAKVAENMNSHGRFIAAAIRARGGE